MLAAPTDPEAKAKVAVTVGEVTRETDMWSSPERPLMMLTKWKRSMWVGRLGAKWGIAATTQTRC